MKLLNGILLATGVLTLVGCSTEQKPNPKYNNTAYFNEFGVGLPKELKASYFCYSTWMSTFSFAGGNYAYYDLDKPLQIGVKLTKGKNLEFEEYFTNGVNNLLEKYEDKASFGEKKLFDFNSSYSYYKNNGSNQIAIVYFYELNDLYVYSFATHKVGQ